MKFELQECKDKDRWNTTVTEHGGHPLQLWGWGELKAKHGWQPLRYFLFADNKAVGAIQILKKSLPWPFKAFYYVPRGPVVWGIDKTVFSREISLLLRKKLTGVSVLFEPDEEQYIYDKSWKKTSQRILLAHTLVLDLCKFEDALLANMTKKTRQYIRKSKKEGVSVRVLKGREEVSQALEVYKQTAARAHFALHDDTYYTDMTKVCADNIKLYGAFFEDRMVSFLWNIESQATVFELYGGVTDEGMRLRANYALKWYAICDAKQRGIGKYDMNGLLNEGVSNFKQGFASHETDLVGAYELSLSPLSIIWNKALPLAKRVMRLIKR